MRQASLGHLFFFFFLVLGTCSQMVVLDKMLLLAVIIYPWVIWSVKFPRTSPSVNPPSYIFNFWSVWWVQGFRTFHLTFSIAFWSHFIPLNLKPRVNFLMNGLSDLRLPDFPAEETALWKQRQKALQSYSLQPCAVILGRLLFELKKKNNGASECQGEELWIS